MGILDFIKSKHTKNSDNTSLITSGQSNIAPLIQKHKKIRNIMDFIEYALISNGGNYEDIHQKLLAMLEFSKHARDYGINCDFSCINETIMDFFTKQSDIVKFSLVENKPFAAFYNKKRNGWQRYDYRGVTVIQDAKAQKPVMYFGRRNENALIHRKDKLLAFGDDIVVLRDESKDNYDEIPISGHGTYAEFNFNKENHITSVKYRYMTHPKLGFWSKEQVCEFDSETNQYKLISGHLPDNTDNTPNA